MLLEGGRLAGGDQLAKSTISSTCAWPMPPMPLVCSSATSDRGGVFASLLERWNCSNPKIARASRGFVINKFRGDETLLRPGVAMIETRLGVQCLGVVPFLHDLGLDEEDGVALEDRASAARCWRNLESGSARALRIGVIALPHMAKFHRLRRFGA